MHRKALILMGLGALVALLPTPADAANWLKGCQGTGQDNLSIGPGSFACLVPTSATDDSGILSVDSCENIDIFYWDDADGDGVAGGGTVQARSCPTTDALRTDTDTVQDAACFIMENLTLDGVPSTNTEAIYGIAANRMKITVTAYATTSEPIRVEVRCNGPWR